METALKVCKVEERVLAAAVLSINFIVKTYRISVLCVGHEEIPCGGSCGV
jgi:hypothetical protein